MPRKEKCYAGLNSGTNQSLARRASVCPQHAETLQRPKELAVTIGNFNIRGGVMRNICVSIFFLFTSLVVWAQVDRGGNVLSEDDGSGDASVFGPWMLPAAIGAAAGYFIERAYTKRKKEKEGIRCSSEYLGGKTGAIVGAIVASILIGLMR